MDLGSPANLTREQVKILAEKNSNAALSSETVEVKAGEDFRHTLEMRENDVYLVTLKKVL
jgi:xylan 1,4-beta-xylosidase